MSEFEKRSLKYLSADNKTASALESLESDFVKFRKNDEIQAGLVLQSVFENFPDYYEMFVEYLSVPTNSATKMRELSLFYDILDPEEQCLFRQLSRQFRRYLMSDKIRPEIKSEIISGSIRSQEDYRKALIKHRVISREEILADSIAHLPKTHYDKFIKDALNYYGSYSRTMFKRLYKDKDTSTYPHRFVDMLINIEGYDAISSYYNFYSRKYLTR